MSSRYSYTKEVEVEISIADMEPRSKNAKVAAAYSAAWNHLESIGDPDVVFAGTLVAEWEPHDPDTNHGGRFSVDEVKDIVVLIDGTECNAENHAPLHALIGVFEAHCEKITEDMEDSPDDHYDE